ncbi:MAG: energy-coupling factor transporter transmembrane component T [Nitriliruptoraceae bacterium]
MSVRRLRLPRAVHPGAWWLWALGLAAAAARTTNVWLLLLVLAVAGLVVTARRSDAPWGRSFAVFLKLGLVVIAIRVVFQTVLGGPVPGTVLVDLPEVPLPAWAAGITLGGPVTDAALAGALVEGLRLATMLACLGAANALANPKRLLASVPAALYEVGVAVVVALSFAPSLATAVQRVRAARRLRGRPDRGVRSLVTVAMPVLEDALERSLALAAAMDSRGYGRRASVPAHRRRMTAWLTLAGLGAILVGLYGLLDGTGPQAAGLPVLLAGVFLAAVALRTAGAGVLRTRYRPDPWLGPEWATALSGAAAATGTIVTSLLAPAALAPAAWPLAAVPLPAAATIGILVASLPAWVTPRPPLTTAPPVGHGRGGRVGGRPRGGRAAAPPGAATPPASSREVAA